MSSLIAQHWWRCRVQLFVWACLGLQLRGRRTLMAASMTAARVEYRSGTGLSAWYTFQNCGKSLPLQRTASKSRLYLGPAKSAILPLRTTSAIWDSPRYKLSVWFQSRLLRFV